MSGATTSGRRTRKRAAAAFAIALAIGLAVTTGAAPAAAQDEAELSGKIVFLERWPEPQYAPFWEKVVADYLALHPEVEIDHQAIAASLSRLLDEPVSPGDLPFETFRFGPGETSVSFDHDGGSITCEIPGECRRLEPAVVDPTALPSPAAGKCISVGNHAGSPLRSPSRSAPEASQ